MADDPNNFRDPKVTPNETASTGGPGKWIAVAVGVILLLLLLAWLLGFFADDDVDAVVVPTEDDNVVVSE